MEIIEVPDMEPVDEDDLIFRTVNHPLFGRFKLGLELSPGIVLYF